MGSLWQIVHEYNRQISADVFCFKVSPIFADTGIGEWGNHSSLRAKTMHEKNTIEFQVIIYHEPQVHRKDSQGMSRAADVATRRMLSSNVSSLSAFSVGISSSKVPRRDLTCPQVRPGRYPRDQSLVVVLPSSSTKYASTNISMIISFATREDVPTVAKAGR